MSLLEEVGPAENRVSRANEETLSIVRRHLNEPVFA